MSYMRAMGDTSYDAYLNAGGTPCSSNSYYDPNTASCYGIPVSTTGPATPAATSTIGGAGAAAAASLASALMPKPPIGAPKPSTIAGIPTTYLAVGAVGLALLIALR